MDKVGYAGIHSLIFNHCCAQSRADPRFPIPGDFLSTSDDEVARPDKAPGNNSRPAMGSEASDDLGPLTALAVQPSPQENQRDIRYYQSFSTSKDSELPIEMEQRVTVILPWLLSRAPSTLISILLCFL